MSRKPNNRATLVLRRMAVSRPHIPAHIARQVRQRCGYGCVICGDLIIDYHHMTEFSKNPVHEVENIVLLCTKHHREISSGRLSEAKIRAAANSPYALRPGASNHNYILDEGQAYTIRAGGSIFELAPGDPGIDFVSMYDLPLFYVRFYGGVPHFSFKIFDHSDRLVLSLEENAIKLRRPLWDVTLKGAYLRVHYGPRAEIAKIKIRDSTITFERLIVHSRGTVVGFENDSLWINDDQTYGEFHSNYYRGFMGNIVRIIGINCEFGGYTFRRDTECAPALLSEREFLQLLRRRAPKIIADPEAGTGYGVGGAYHPRKE